jgi:hypothetical protein
MLSHYGISLSNTPCFIFYFILFYKSYLHDILSMVFVRSSLNPWGDNASADEGHLYLTLYVALFLIQSI